MDENVLFYELVTPSMTSRERVLAALDHREPDRIPVDFGSTAVTGIHVSCVAALRDYYGLEKKPVKVHEPYQMLGYVDDDLKDAMGIDTEGVFPRKTMFGFENRGWKEWRCQDGLEALVPEDFKTTIDENGDVLIYPEGDTAAPASGRMPKGGFFFDAIVRQPPIDEDNLNVEDNLEEFGPVTEADLEHLRTSAQRARASGRAVVACFGGMAFGDIALVPAPFLKRPKGIRDIAEWYMSTRLRRDYVHAIFARQCEYALENLVKIREAVNGNVDAVFLCGTDFGTQDSSFCSAGTFNELWLPYYTKINAWIHANTNWKCFKHSCGSVDRFIPSFIEGGFDILNPVQCSAANMGAEHLKSSYGDKLVFWGGGADTQKTLPFGQPDQVREEALRRCEVFSRDGGFVFNTIHNIQANTPVKNIVAMLEAAHHFSGRR
ncbi:MAG: methyltransferase [Bryobacteraceae bacterium]|nr:methyltransferase [Bryobacteraceae bacterium]